MKKEIILALIIGFAIGSIFAIIAVRFPLIKESTQQNQAQIKIDQITPTLTLVKTQTALEVSLPQDQSFATDDNIKLSGKTQPDSTVIIESSLTSDLVETEKDGSFTANLSLVEGGNPIYITAIDNKGNEESKIVTVFYTSEKL